MSTLAEPAQKITRLVGITTDEHPSRAHAGSNRTTLDEHGLPRLSDGRRWVEVIHAPWYLETPSHVIPFLGLAAFLFLSDVFKTFAIWNIAIHLLIFIPTVHIPALVTAKMSWIDLSWPLGLLALGLEIWCLGSASLWHRGIVGLQYFLIGLRMTAWVLANWHIVRKGRELPRYQYRRLVWEESPFFFGLVTNTSMAMQLEICEQWVWNVTWLCVPAMLQSLDSASSWHWLQFLGHSLWALSFMCETIGDQQKFSFVLKCQKEGVEARLGRTGGKVCNVGFWRYTRHPNYFFQWLGWVGISLASIPALLHLKNTITPLAWMAFAVLLCYVPVGSYLMMVYYTGCIPAEAYTMQTRTEYREYQKTTNMFFPGPPRRGSACAAGANAPLLSDAGHWH